VHYHTLERPKCAYQHNTFAYTHGKPEIDQGGEVMNIFFEIFFLRASRRGGRPRGYKFLPELEFLKSL
jgi:hypothetical protein